MVNKTIRQIDLKQCRELLLAKRSRLLSRISEEPIVLTRQDYVADNDDQATFTHDEFVSLELRRRNYDEFKQVEDALTRLENGSYGICMECGRHLTAKRLLALPWAESCTACEEELTRSAAVPTAWAA